LLDKIFVAISFLPALDASCELGWNRNTAFPGCQEKSIGKNDIPPKVIDKIIEN